MRDVKDRGGLSVNGFLALAVLIGLLVWGANRLLAGGIEGVFTFLEEYPAAIFALIVALFIIARSFRILEPNEAMVLLFFGSYLGTIKTAGFRMTIPFTTVRRVSLRYMTNETQRLKVNDRDGNPIEIGGVVIWHVTDAAQAALNVDDYSQFVSVQAETALRSLASRYHYDTSDDSISLRGAPDEIAGEFATELRARLGLAGISILEARLSHLAYAPEIAAAMLRRQQAQAVVGARRVITENAVEMAEDAVRRLAASGHFDLDSRERARLVSNLMVALVADREATPVLDIGHA